MLAVIPFESRATLGATDDGRLQLPGDGGLRCAAWQLHPSTWNWPESKPPGRRRRRHRRQRCGCCHLALGLELGDAPLRRGEADLKPDNALLELARGGLLPFATSISTEALAGQRRAEQHDLRRRAGVVHADAVLVGEAVVAEAGDQGAHGFMPQARAAADLEPRGAPGPGCPQEGENTLALIALGVLHLLSASRLVPAMRTLIMNSSKRPLRVPAAREPVAIGTGPVHRLDKPGGCRPREVAVAAIRMRGTGARGAVLRGAAR